MSAQATRNIERQPLLVGEVIELARDFVSQDFAKREGFWGAYLTGSINRMDPDTAFPAYLDVDIRVVLASAVRDEVEALQYQGYLLDCNITPSGDYQSSEAILPLPGKACHFVGNHILLDSRERLGRLQEDVSAAFGRRQWVARRVASSLASARAALGALKSATDTVGTLHALGEFLLYACASISIAHLAPPTHRRALVNLRSITQTHAASALHAHALAALGSDQLETQETRHFLQHCIDAFDRGLAVKRQPVPFNWMLHPCLRSYLQDGALELIDEGAHREAIFWLLRFFHIAIAAIRQDGTPQDKLLHGNHLMRFLAALGLESTAALQTRILLCESLVAEIDAYTQGVIATSPLLVD
ncbi:hypothetical protein [Thiocystis violacea]|uniref:hypothetical protein n=1 Tax=Thiocystis violacea TaxID=13725 RepID=UPI0019051751|nr:hypothetical protein [Thiocystis violacea]MBK1723918.1 hypothetical protein [Thiocystis violacea]